MTRAEIFRWMIVVSLSIPEQRSDWMNDFWWNIRVFIGIVCAIIFCVAGIRAQLAEMRS